MKSDRELLGLAAKAAGIDVAWNEHWECFKRKTPLIGLGGERHPWVPLDDDGDALRLAVAIPACVVIDNDMQWCGVHLNGNRGKYDLGQAFAGLDAAAATRRAIVRAAAVIGEAM